MLAAFVDEFRIEAILDPQSENEVRDSPAPRLRSVFLEESRAERGKQNEGKLEGNFFEEFRDWIYEEKIEIILHFMS